MQRNHGSTKVTILKVFFHFHSIIRAPGKKYMLSLPEIFFTWICQFSSWTNFFSETFLWLDGPSLSHRWPEMDAIGSPWPWMGTLGLTWLPMSYTGKSVQIVIFWSIFITSDFRNPELSRSNLFLPKTQFYAFVVRTIILDESFLESIMIWFLKVSWK